MSKIMSQDETLNLTRSAALPYVEMRQAGHSCACYRGHSHDEFSFGIIDAGVADYRNRNQHNRIGAGDLVTINPDDLHSCNPHAGRWSYRMLFVDTHWIGELQQDIAGGSTDYRPFPGLFESNPNSFNQFDRLYGILEREHNPLVAESELFAFLQTRFENATMESRPQVLAQPELTRVRDLLMENLNDNLTLEALCEEADLNRYQLIRQFKQAYGQPPHAYQIDQRIKRAKHLLRERDNSLHTIAYELGFSDQAHFQRHFKQRLAMTPGQYRSFWV